MWGESIQKYTTWLLLSTNMTSNIYNKYIPKFMVWQVTINLKSFAF
jgi:hypothetical protein